MGSPPGQGPDGKREQPQHPVKIPQPLAISTHEVTFDEWDACASNGDCNPGINSGSSGRGRQPVINVTWNEAQKYVGWLSKLTGQPYRLLTEAEWEYAARAKPDSTVQQQTLYSFGNDDEKFLPDYAWYGRNAEDGPHEVGTKKANPFGLYDMHGNVWEWVEDCFREGYAGAGKESVAWTADNCGKRVIRGGAFRFSATVLRSASRDWAAVESYDNDRGFRVARDLKP
jgi:formylglycine-generating enzyme required for sulfatase activity